MPCKYTWTEVLKRKKTRLEMHCAAFADTSGKPQLPYLKHSDSENLRLNPA